jgi:hypothetical protein
MLGEQTSEMLGNIPHVDDQASTPTSVSNWTVTLFIISFISLYILAIAIGAIFNVWVEQFFPDPDKNSSLLQGIWNNDNTIKIALAAIFVSFPIFTKLAIKLKKQTVTNPAIKDLKLRKTLIYLTLAMAFIVIAAHTTLMLYYFLSGNETINSLMHLLVTLFVAGSLFFYFITDNLTKNFKDSIFFIFMTLVGVVAIIYGVSTIPSPIEQTKIKNDQERISAIQNLQSLISKYYLEHNKLPTSSFLQDKLTDPQKGNHYRYAVTGSIQYKLCTTFETDSPAIKKNLPQDSQKQKQQFSHQKGDRCFDLKIDKQYFPATMNLVSIKKRGDCSWEVAMSLKNFTPNSPLTVSSKGRVADKCNPKDFVDYSWTAKSSYSIEENGAAVIKYTHGDYGKYTYTFTDNKGKKASQTLEYSLTSIPAASSTPILTPSGKN